MASGGLSLLVPFFGTEDDTAALLLALAILERDSTADLVILSFLSPENQTAAAAAAAAEPGTGGSGSGDGGSGGNGVGNNAVALATAVSNGWRQQASWLKPRGCLKQLCRRS